VLFVDSQAVTGPPVPPLWNSTQAFYTPLHESGSYNKISSQTILVVDVDESPSCFRISTFSKSGTRIIGSHRRVELSMRKDSLRRSRPSFWTVRPWHPLNVVA
jgi:hypothetical protein